MSNVKLSPSEISLLDKGLTFVPTPKISLSPILEAASKFSRRLKIHNYFHSRPQLKHSTKPKYTKKSSWTPSDKIINEDLVNHINQFTKEITETIQIQQENNNLSVNERKSIKFLKQHPNLVIKKADKGSAVVLLDKANYIQEGLRQLNNSNHYKQLDEPLYPQTAIKIDSILTKLLTDHHITKKQYEYLKPPENPRPRRFYMLPKIHKPQTSWTIPNKLPPGRPIVSDCNSESEKIAEFIDDFIKVKATQHPSYVKDTYDFLDKVKDITIPPNSFLVTLDVESMYTNINHDSGLAAIRETFSDTPNQSLLDTVIQLLEISLKCNDFEFDNKIFLQMSGTSMGKKFAPHYADIFMAKLEKEALEKCPLKPSLYLRYLDDIFIIWPHSRDDFTHFLNVFNSHLPPIKFKASIQENSVDYLDTTIFKDQHNPSILRSKVYFKPTDTHQLLHKKSFHPKHTFKGIIKSQITRFHRICSFEDDFERAWSILYNALNKRNYSKRMLRKLKSETIRNLEKHMVLDEIAIPGSSSFGSFKCSKYSCLTCRDMEECQNFTSSNTDITYSINSHMSCFSENLIYLYTCKFCQVQYVGETGKTLRDRHNRHRSAVRCLNDSETLFGHLMKYHSDEEICISQYILTPIEQLKDQGLNNLNKLERLKRESFWIDKLQTMEPNGLNQKILEKHVPISKHQNVIPFVVPFSKTAFKAAKIVKNHIQTLKDSDDFFDEFQFDVITAFSRHKNLKDLLVSSKLK